MKAAIPLVILLALAGFATAATTVRIEANSFGYIAPVVTIASGDSVVWFSIDETHVQRDGINAGDARQCFFAPSVGGGDSPPVTFALENGVVRADGDVCLNARVAPGGLSAVIPYFCTLHATMRGVLVVTA